MPEFGDTMADLFHEFGGDLVVGNSGDLFTAEGSTLGQQRVLRRLLTNLGGYIWNLSYGAGLPAMVGETIDAARIAGIARSQMLLEAGVAQSPPPTCTVVSTPLGVVTATISYTDAENGEPQVRSVEVSSSGVVVT